MPHAGPGVARVFTHREMDVRAAFREAYASCTPSVGACLGVVCRLGACTHRERVLESFVVWERVPFRTPSVLEACRLPPRLRLTAEVAASCREPAEFSPSSIRSAFAPLPSSSAALPQPEAGRFLGTDECVFFRSVHAALFRAILVQATLVPAPRDTSMDSLPQFVRKKY